MNTVADRNNNPGNIKDPSTGQFRTFQTPQEGYAALLNDLQIKQSGRSQTGLKPESTLADFARTYAPSSDKNNPAQYTANLANIMKVRPDTKLHELNLGAWADAIARAEGYSNATGTPQGSNVSQSSAGSPNVQFKQPENKVGKFVANQFLGAGPVNQNAGIGESIIQNTIGNKGLLGVGQLPGRVAAGKISSNVAEDISKSASSLQDMSTKLSEAYMKETNPQQKEQLRKAIIDSQKTINQQFGRANTEGDLQANNITAEQALGTGINAATTVAPFGMAAKATLLGKVAQGAKLGAYAGIGQEMASNKSAGDVVKGGLIGGATGGALSAAGAGIQKLAEFLPQRIVKTFIPTKSEGVLDYTMTKPLGSPKAMLMDSENSIEKLGSDLGSVLTKSKPTVPLPSSAEILDSVAKQFPNANLTALEVGEQLKRIAPLQKGIVDKLVQGVELTAEELHSLNSAIGNATFKSVLDEPALKAGKEVGNAFYQTVSSALKKSLPESEPLFEQLSKEYGLYAALKKAVASGGKASIGMREILSFMAGGPVGAGLSFAAKSPTVNLKMAGALSGLAGKTAGKYGTAAILPATRGILSATRPNKGK